MTNLSIKGVPDAWAEAIRRRAASNHRSLQGELMAIIEQAALHVPSQIAGMTNGAPAASLAHLGGANHPAVHRGWKSIEQIAAEHVQRLPQPISHGPLAVDLIREDRDAR